MAAERRLDLAMAAFRAVAEARAASLTAMRLDAPQAEMRALTETLNLPHAEGDPAIAERGGRWLPVGGRRLLSRVHRPRPRLASKSPGVAAAAAIMGSSLHVLPCGMQAIGEVGAPTCRTPWCGQAGKTLSTRRQRRCNRQEGEWR
jgi:hypothetical protein